ncbi:integrase [Nocardia transvalensis]|uniref:Integrase n=1 Tax=Nocardia transvalensis TaxID=37333 RepID=A0A7W9PGN2_9NOCA|nr:tyrosine-type recombinase/integrase [Nocardia transvalensis]MBB5915254.1 integrase [Nocardia transvalensis]
MLAVPAQWVGPIYQFEEILRAAGRPKTTRYLRIYHLRRFAVDHPRTDPFEITKAHLRTWMAQHDWAPSTRASYRSSLCVFYAWAHADGHMPTNPAYELPTITPPPAVPRPAPDAVVDDALRNVALRTRVMVTVLAFTGLRRHEAAKLHTRDLEWLGDGWVIRVDGKGRRKRIIPVDDEFAAVLRALPPGYVFPGQIDGHLSAAHFGKVVSAALEGSWTAHNLRHRFASSAYAVEKDIRAVQELLGHAHVTTTQIYTWVPSESMRRAAAGSRRGLDAA